MVVRLRSAITVKQNSSVLHSTPNGAIHIMPVHKQCRHNATVSPNLQRSNNEHFM